MSKEPTPINRPKRRKIRPLRWFSILVPLAAVWIVVVGPWWHTWVEASDVEDHSARVEAEINRRAVGSALPSTGPILAGAASVEIPCDSRSIPLAGYGARAMFEGNAGVADPVAAKAIVVQSDRLRIAIVTADLLLINRRLADETLRRLNRQSANGWRREQVYFGATHTHSGPGGFAGSPAETLGLGFYDSETTAMLADSLTKAVLQAEASLTGCTLSTRATEVDPALIRNRTLESDSANRRLDVLRFKEIEGGRTVATAAVFGAHATCRHSSDMMVSGDYPGEFCRAVEERVGGVSLFLAGAVGSMAPPKDSVARDELSRWLGTRLADEACELLESPAEEFAEPALGVLGVWIPLPEPSVRLSRRLFAAPTVTKALLPGETWFHALRLGDRVLLGTPADFSGVLAADLRDCQPGCTAVVTGFCGDYVGYVLPDDYYRLDRYETGLCFYGPRFGGICVRALAAMTRILGENPLSEK